MANISRSMVIVEEQLNNEIVFATMFIGIIVDNVFFGLQASCSNLCPKGQLAKIDISNAKRYRDANNNDDIYPTYALITDTQPSKDSRISILDFESREVSTDVQYYVLEAFYDYRALTTAC